MNDDLHDQVLNAYFWHFVDRGDAPADTPLFKGTCKDNSLAHVIGRESGLRHHEAEATIELARREIAL